MTATEIPPVPDGAQPVPTPCPRCDTMALHVEARLPPALGSPYSPPAGAHPERTAYWWPYLVCRACRAEAPARSYDPDARDGQGQTVFVHNDLATLEERDEEADRALEDAKHDRMFPPQEEPDWEDR